MTLLLNPEAPLLVVIDVDRIGPAGRREKQFGGLRDAFGDLSSTACGSPQSSAECVGPRLAWSRLRRLSERRAGTQARAQTDPGTKELSPSDAIRHWPSPV
jgi:hypothetical protein